MQFINPLLVGFVLPNLQGTSENVSFRYEFIRFGKLTKMLINPKSVDLTPKSTFSMTVRKESCWHELN